MALHLVPESATQAMDDTADWAVSNMPARIQAAEAVIDAAFANYQVALSASRRMATRADKIIAAGSAERTKYQAKNLHADSAMACGAQIGYLHGEVRRLCSELESYEPTEDKNLGYATVYCSELDCDVLVGFDYSAGEDSQIWGPPENCHEGSPEELTVCEVRVNGIDIAAVLLERVAEQLTDAALARGHDAQENARYGDEP